MFTYYVGCSFGDLILSFVFQIVFININFFLLVCINSFWNTLLMYWWCQGFLHTRKCFCSLKPLLVMLCCCDCKMFLSSLVPLLRPYIVSHFYQLHWVLLSHKVPLSPTIELASFSFTSSLLFFEIFLCYQNLRSMTKTIIV